MNHYHEIQWTVEVDDLTIEQMLHEHMQQAMADEHINWHFYAKRTVFCYFVTSVEHVFYAAAVIATYQRNNKIRSVKTELN